MYYKKIKLLSWNVRGLVNNEKANVVRDVVRASRCDICCMQETKFSGNGNDLNYFSRVLPSYFERQYAILYALGTRGGCFIAWKRDYEMMNSWSTRHSVTAILRQSSTAKILAVTTVYGPTTDEDKPTFLMELKQLKEMIDHPWALTGDFNMVRFLIDRSGDLRGMDLMTLFNDLITETDLMDVPLKNRAFTWSSKRPQPVFSKLDRIFITNNLSNKFPIITMNAFETTVSDHAPLLLHCRQNETTWKLFCLENFWLQYQEVRQIIHDIWSTPDDSIPCTDMFQVRTKRLQVALRQWHLTNFKNSNTRMEESKKQILILDQLEESRQLTQAEFRTRIRQKEVVFQIANILEAQWS